MSNCVALPDASGCSSVTLDGVGIDVGGNSDQFTFMHHPVTGDSLIAARVDLVVPVAGAEAGIMMRESPAATARYVGLLFSATNGLVWQRRTVAGGGSLQTHVPIPAGTRWVALMRRSPTIAAYYSVDGSRWVLIGSEPGPPAATLLVGLAGASGNPSAPARASFSSVAASVLLPDGWEARDVGAPTRPGLTTFSAGAFTLETMATQIGGKADAMRFTYRRVTGDFDLVTRVASLSAHDKRTKAGVMVRDSLEADATQVSLLLQRTPALTFERRLGKGMSSVSSSVGAFGAPAWMKLERRGNTITAFWSRDGQAWQFVGYEIAAFPPALYVGIAASSPLINAALIRANAVFDGVTATMPTRVNVPPVVSVSSPAAGTLLTLPASVTVTAVASDQDGAVTQVELFAGSTSLGIDTTAPYSATWTPAAPGTYQLTAVARDTGGAAVTSSPMTVVVNAPLLRRVAFTPSPDHDALVAEYAAAFFATGTDVTTGAPVAVARLGKPAVVGGEISVDVSATIQALPAGQYLAVVVAYSRAGAAAASLPSAPFLR